MVRVQLQDRIHTVIKLYLYRRLEVRILSIQHAMLCLRLVLDLIHLSTDYRQLLVPIWILMSTLVMVEIQHDDIAQRNSSYLNPFNSSWNFISDDERENVELIQTKRSTNW